MNKTSLPENVDLMIERLKPIVNYLITLGSLKDKLFFIDERSEIKEFIAKNITIKDFFDFFDEEELFIVKSLILLNQGDLLLLSIMENQENNHYLQETIDKLKPVEKFYEPLGGLLGYHLEMLELIHEKKHHHPGIKINDENYLKPPLIDITHLNDKVRESIKIGLENMPFLVEIYPVGGAGDRLMLQDEFTKEDLPAAELKFEGFTLLEGLIRDLEAKEYLHYKIYGKQIETPIVLMTSDEKNNDQYILNTCKKNNWFGRKKENFFFIKQPLVPVLSEKGTWVLSDKYHFMMKPGGHGVIWKLLLDAGLFDRFLQMNKLKAIVRQINNPLAGLDYSMLSFAGFGFKGNKNFGFTSCPRLLNTAEGMDVLIEKKDGNAFIYSISNIEYTDFVKKGIHDLPENEGSLYSAFPTNTNILFIDLKAVRQATRLCPIPGKLINMKNKTSCITKNKVQESLNTGRLESLMQNISDLLKDRFLEKKISFKFEDLQTFLTYNDRKKTISVTKKTYKEGESIVETPLGAYYDKMLNYYDLLSSCEMQIPNVPSVEDYIKEGPSFIFRYHPALGPIYDLIKQKIRGGFLHKHSLVILEIANIIMDHVEVKGALKIVAENICGHKDADNILIFSQKAGKCILKNVKIENDFFKNANKKSFWKDDIEPKDSLRINLKGHSLFTAENVTFKGSFEITVPANEHWTAIEKNGQIMIKKMPLKDDFNWYYSMDNDFNIKLSL